jgi:hypothetical protein
MENLRIANALLEELSSGTSNIKNSLKLRVLEAYAVLAGKTKAMVEKATSAFLDILETDRDYVPA